MGVLAGLFIFYRKLVTTCFDEPFARTRGISAEWINAGIVMITSVAVVLAFKVVGIFLISALIIIPPVSALLVSSTFKQVLCRAVFFGVGSVWGGVYASFVFNIPCTIEIRSPANALKSVDFPTFGLPTIAPIGLLIYFPSLVVINTTIPYLRSTSVS